MSDKRRAPLGLGAFALAATAVAAFAHASPGAAAAPSAAAPVNAPPLNGGQPTPYPLNTLAPLTGDTSLPYPAYGSPVPGVDAGAPAPDVPATITLQQAILIGFARNPQLASARADVGVQAALVRLQRAGLLPSFSAAITLDHSHSQPGGTNSTTFVTGTGTGTGGTGTGGTGTGGARAARAPGARARAAPPPRRRIPRASITRRAPVFRSRCAN